MEIKKSISQDRDQNQTFDQYFLFSSIPNVKLGLWVTIFIFAFSSLIHKLCFPDSLIIRYLDHSSIIIPFIVLTLLSIYFKVFHKWLQSILAILNIFSVSAIYLVGATSDIHQPGYYFFLPWTMLVMMGTFIFYRVRFWVLFTTCCVMVVAITAAMITNHTFRDMPEIFLVNVSFIISMASLGYFIISYRTDITRKLFVSERNLQKANEILSNEIIERKVANEAVIQSEKKYHELVEAIPDWIYVVDRNFNIVVFNTSFKNKNNELGFPEDVLGRNIFEVLHIVGQSLHDELNYVFKEGKELITEESSIVNGVRYFIETRKIPIFNVNEVHQVMTIIRDISKKVEVEELKLKNAEQKEILLREIHHRVKNNLAIVISLLGMQVRENKNPEFKILADDIELRIRSMALIHEHLYKSEELDRIPFGNYIEALLTIISTTYIGHNVKLKTNFDPAEVKIETAMPLGLIINEILTNAFKYAFNQQQEGIIEIDLKVVEPDTGLYNLIIKDNGIGLPDSVLINQENSLGMFIIHLLAKQIEAELTIDNHNGTAYSIVFKAIANKKV